MSFTGKKLSVSLLIALVGFPQISETIYTPALPSVAHSLNTTAYMAEATLAIYFIGFALGVLIWGAISDFIGRKPTMILGICLYGIATFFCGQTQMIEMLLLGRFFQALGASVGSVITQTILRDAYTGQERSRLFLIMSAALAFSPAIGPLFGGFITQFLGWRANFIFLTLLAIFLLLWTICSLKETLPKNRSRQSFKQLKTLAIGMISSKKLLGHVLLIGGTNSIIFCFYQEAPFIFIEQLELSPFSYGCFGLLIAAATILASRFCYRQNYRSGSALIHIGSLCILLGGAFFSLLVISKVFFVAQLGLILALSALFLVFFGIGLIIPNSLSSALKVYQMSAGTAGSIFGGCYYCFIAACTWMMGALHNGTALPLPGYITVLGVVIFFGAYLSRERNPTESINLLENNPF